MAKTFYQWAEEKNLELPLLNEKAARAGFAHWAYPDLYVRSHYPDGWFMPRAADARQKMGDHDPTHTLHSDLHQAKILGGQPIHHKDSHPALQTALGGKKSHDHG
jgi:hypothetical protein